MFLMYCGISKKFQGFIYLVLTGVKAYVCFKNSGRRLSVNESINHKPVCITNPAIPCLFLIFLIYYLGTFAGQPKQDPKSIKCYNEKAGDKYQNCWKDDGFETCFSKYDSSEFISYRIHDWLNQYNMKKENLATRITWTTWLLMFKNNWVNINLFFRSQGVIKGMFFKKEDVPYWVWKPSEWNKVCIMP